MFDMTTPRRPRHKRPAPLAQPLLLTFAMRFDAHHAPVTLARVREGRLRALAALAETAWEGAEA